MQLLTELPDSQVQQLIAELNEILAHDVVDKEGVWKKKLRSQSHQLFELLPQTIQEQLLLERDPHGNVQVLFLLVSSFGNWKPNLLWLILISYFFSSSRLPRLKLKRC